MGDNEDDETDIVLSWGVEDRLAYETGSNARMLCEGMVEVIQWVAKATRWIMAQKQQALKIGFVSSLAPQCMGPTPKFNDA